MRLLVIGGTVFVGRAVVEAALARGHEVTIFHRGQHGAELFGDAVERIRGDRDRDLDRLGGREWDAVVDTCGFRPEQLEASGEALADAVDTYVFVSTAGVYRDWPDRPIPDEGAPLHDSDVQAYSELKAASERAIEAVLPGRVLHARPGTIVGPYENIGRLPWWLRRMAAGGRVVAPGPPEATTQLIDVRDLAEFLLDGAEQRLAGPFNLVSRPGAIGWGEFLETCREVAGPEAELVWTDPEVIMERVEAPWSALPLWPLPGAAGLFDIGVDKAGLQLRPLRDTVQDTWAWLQEGDLDSWRSEVRATGLDPALERELLE